MDMDMAALIQALRNWMNSKGEQVPAAGQAVNEQINAALPQVLSGRDAVLKQRERLAMIDQQLKDAER